MLQPATAIGLRLTLAYSVSADLLLLLQNIGFDATLAIFLIAAFLDDNLLSLVYMLFLALGMGMKHRARVLTWRYLVLPCWILLLLWQYEVLVGWHPLSNHRGAFPQPTILSQLQEHTLQQNGYDSYAKSSMCWY